MIKTKFPLIDRTTFNKLPNDIKRKTKDYLFIQNVGNDLEEYFIEKRIEFPPEYQQAGISILAYFGTNI